MNKKFMSKLVPVAIVTTMALFPVSVSAFWPFENGQVKGANTESGFFNMMNKVYNLMGRGPNSSMMYYRGPSGATGSVGVSNEKIRLDEAVKNGKITQAQEDEILARLLAIKTKQEEVRVLEKSFADWMKTNSISTELLAPPRPMMQQRRPQGPSGGWQQ